MVFLVSVVGTETKSIYQPHQHVATLGKFLISQ